MNNQPPISESPAIRLLDDGLWWTPSRAAASLRARGDQTATAGVMRLMFSLAHREGLLEQRRTAAGRVAYRRKQ